ncbi:M1 family metallopeptidase [Streptomyces nondiastaticus]|uniref:M1 family metallopeptidase n=1 Tax=Streptomyces TaxID=1883 RepID=UPI0026746E3F|nr:M1 family metallopeptidase [Streptomyces sp. VNUA116]WKU43305.1 M1 family metallopeptidase [Streptomyces sp. VNUA116]
MRRGLTTLTSAVAACLLLAVPASAAGPAPGAAGVGDPYYPDAGNGGYDVAHYDLRLKYQPRTDRLDGTATLLATATRNLSRFNLDFLLDVDEVLVNGKKAAFARSGTHELEVTPATALAQGSPLTVVVRYGGTPSEKKIDGAAAWHRTADGAVVVDEPTSAPWWYPSNDHPSDKATYDISVAVPDGLQAVSNGVLASRTSKLGWTRYNWRSAEPQATYLSTLAIGRFDITEGTTASGIPVVNAYGKGLGDNLAPARAGLERTGEVVDWESSLFGPYPFAAAGGFVPDVPGYGAVETQTRPFYTPGMFENGAFMEVVVHETAHQWFGNSVSVRNWRDLWLSEGFATYAQWLWSEKEGEGTAQELADHAYSSTPADDPFWQVRPADPGAGQPFHNAVYRRGAMALQALRNRIGDRDFFAVLKRWQEERRYGNATVQDFVQLSERVSGKPLQSLFDAWLFTPSKPAPMPRAGGGGGTSSLAPQARAPEPRSWKKIEAAHSAHRWPSHRH